MVLVRRLNTEQVFMILTFGAGGDQGYRCWLLISPVMHAALLPNAVFVKVYKVLRLKVVRVCLDKFSAI